MQGEYWFYNEIVGCGLVRSTYKAMETVMGNSLHNKIRLGRQSPLASRKVQALIALGAVIPLSWLILNVLH